MSNWKRLAMSAVAGLALISGAANAANEKSGLTQTGKPDLKSAGPMAFGPSGILFVGDPRGAAVFAIAVKPTADAKQPDSFKLEGVDGKIAGLLGSKSSDILITDIVVQPGTGITFLSVSRGKGPDAAAVIMTVDPAGKVGELALDNVAYSKVSLGNAPAEKSGGGRGAASRMESITDLAFVDGQVIVAGLSNEEFSSKLRAIVYPFSDADAGTSVEVFHGAHGKLETRSPIRTFVPMIVAGKPHLLAAYTCTPLVKFPLEDLKPGKKIRGTTVAELGNRNRPLDMIVYNKDGKSFILMANSARGVMKIPTENVDKQEGITEPIHGTAGIKYETIASLKGVEHLAKWNDKAAILLVRTADKTLNLETVDLP